MLDEKWDNGDSGFGPLDSRGRLSPHDCP